MALKIRINYKWRLFIPLVAALWIIIFGMSYWQFYKERQYRASMIHQQLSLINSRILEAYKSDTDPIQFVDFLCRYYRENPIYDLIRVSVYENGKLKRSWGEPIGLSLSEQSLEKGITQTPEVNRAPEDAKPDDDYFYYSANHSDDKSVVVMTVLPIDNDILNAALPSPNIFWIMLALAIATTFFAYISASYFGRNIHILRSVAERAVNDPDFMPEVKVPRDELGDITKQIIHLYNERTNAMQQQKRDHATAIHAIEEKARIERQLTNNINHELRTPIGVIKGYIDTILKSPDMDEAPRTHFLQKAQEHVNRLVDLIADVSALSRLEDGGELIATEALNFHDVTYTISADLAEAGTLGEMSFAYNIPLNCIVIGNYNLLSGMIINLCKNAAAYSKGTLCELIMTGEDDRFYHFEFRDDGIGVNQQHIPHLFERFYRIDSGRSRKSGGTGLGLPIVQNTIVAHGGTISVENRDSGGLVFKFTLPKFRPT
ncbi:MAG: HAMP domain-containing histidine kinase [Muribaculaceae bacterium]|nr:HAMP domain-containing histidine kinase [Muribaculaceae bacterium]